MFQAVRKLGTRTVSILLSYNSYLWYIEPLYIVHICSFIFFSNICIDVFPEDVLH